MNRKFTELLRLEFLHLKRDRTFLILMLLLFFLMTFAVVNTNSYHSEKKQEILKQKDVVQKLDSILIQQIDSLNRGLKSYENSYTLPSNGVRLTYNNHRITWLPFEPLSIIATGQSDIYSNYKKIILYFNDSYEMSTKELVSPLDQLFGQLDLQFIWVNILPLIIILVSFNIISKERESGRLSLIASQPIKLPIWLLKKLVIRFLTIATCIITFTFSLLVVFGIPVLPNFNVFLQIITLVILYSSFWFFLGFLINLLKISSANSLIVLTLFWVLFVFIVPSIINQLGNRLNPVSSRLQVINHHQKMYNEMEHNLDKELETLYQIHPKWYSTDPVTKDLSNSTGWNINYLTKQYIAQLKHQPVIDAYEQQVDDRNKWLQNISDFSPAMLVQRSLTEIAGTSTSHYRSFLRQSKEYAQNYREHVFQKLFTNQDFSAEDISNLPKYKFDKDRVKISFSTDILILLSYTSILIFACLIIIINQKQQSI